MDENVVSFYYQWYGLLIFYTRLLFFQFHTNWFPASRGLSRRGKNERKERPLLAGKPIGWVRFSLVKESTYFRGAEVGRK